MEDRDWCQRVCYFKGYPVLRLLVVGYSLGLLSQKIVNIYAGQLDGVGLVDNRPSPDQLNNFFFLDQ